MKLSMLLIERKLQMITAVNFLFRLDAATVYQFNYKSQLADSILYRVVPTFLKKMKNESLATSNNSPFFIQFIV